MKINLDYEYYKALTSAEVQVTPGGQIRFTLYDEMWPVIEVPLAELMNFLLNDPVAQKLANDAKVSNHREIPEDENPYGFGRSVR